MPDGSFDIIGGGDTGMLYRFHQAEEAAYVQAIKGGIRSITVRGNRVFCAGAGGVVKVSFGELF